MLSVLTLLVGLVLGATGASTAAPASRVLSKAAIVRLINKKITKRARKLTVANAAALGGKPAGLYPTVTDLAAASAIRSKCDPSNLQPITCVTVTISLPRTSRLLLLGQMPFGDDTNNGATGVCDISVDGAVVPNTTVRAGIGGTSGAPSDDDNTAIGVSTVSNAYASGQHAVSILCNETTADIDFNDLSLTVLALPTPS